MGQLPPLPVTSWAGTQGFGVGVCEEPATLTRLNLQPMEGYDDPASDNYGNYIHTPTQSVMVYVPAFKYRIGDLPEGSLPTQKWGVNSVQVWRVNDPSCPSNAVLHRAFIDGGEEKAGFFCDKYLCSPASDGSCAVSIKNKAVISLSTGSDWFVPITSVNGCSDRLDSAITASRLRGNGFQCMSVFQIGAIRLLILAHAQACTNTTYNAWYDSTGQHNSPHGNTYNLKDYDHQDTIWTISTEKGSYANKGLTGSCNVFARSTHNGQNCGIADLKGIVFQVVTGMIATQNQSGPGIKTIYSLNQNVKIGDLDASAMYDIANHHAGTIDNDDGGDWYWDKTQAMIGNDTSGFNYDCAGFLPIQRSSSTNDNMFEQDCVNFSLADAMFPYFGNYYNGSSRFSDYGLWYSSMLDNRSTIDTANGFRACAY